MLWALFIAELRSESIYRSITPALTKTLRPAIEVEYVLLKDGKELGKQLEDWRGASTAGDRLTLARLIDSRGLNPGDYSVEVRVRDHVSGQALVQTAKFVIVK